MTQETVEARRAGVYPTQGRLLPVTRILATT